MTTKNPIAAGVDRAYGRKNEGGAGVASAADVKSALDAITDQVRSLAKDNKSAIEDCAKLSDGLKAKFDDMLTKQGELSTRLQSLEQKGADGGRGEGEGGEKSLSAYLEQHADEIMALEKSRNTINIPMSRKALTNTGVTGAALNQPATILARPLQPLERRLTVRDLLMPGRTDKASFEYPRETGYTNNAAPVSEGSLKPKSEITFDMVTGHVRTIAHLQDVSLQMLADIPYLTSYIEGRMRYKLKLVEENQLLMGSGVGQNLLGIYTAATSYVQPAGIDIDPALETDIDKLRLAILQVELAEAEVTGIVLHPTNWANIELLKDGFRRYLFADPHMIGGASIWGRRVVSTQAMTLGRFLVGDFAMHAQILDREDANVAISYENKDNFERNMATIRVEERLGLAIYRPEAFVKGVLESAS